MKNTSRTFKRISLVLAAVLFIAVQMTSTVLAANPALIDKTKLGSITIHKFDSTGTNAGNAHDGTELPSTAGLGKPLGGIKFTITELPYTVEDKVTLLEAENFISSNAGSLTQHTLTTDSNGIAAFTNLPLKIYYVEEEANSGVQNKIPSFLVTLPMTNPTDSSSWMYDVHAYPKNDVTELSIDKVVLDENDLPASSWTADIGDDVYWKITPAIPADIATMDITGGTGYFYITDNLDSRLDFKDIEVTLVDGTGTVISTLAGGTDFTLTTPAAGASGGQVKVDFNLAAGVQKLVDALANSYSLEIVIGTTINDTAIADLSEKITNSASLYYENDGGDPSTPEPPVTPENPDPEVTLGGIALYKWYNDSTGTDVPLADAEFTIYKTQTDAENGFAMTQSGADWALITDSTGYIYFPGKDIAAIAGPLVGNEIFYLVETKAPSGFELLDKIIQAPLSTTVTAENIKLDSGFTLPITGGAGTLLYTLVGGGLIAAVAIALVIFRRNEKRKKSAAK